jgi:hypothetical protein
MHWTKLIYKWYYFSTSVQKVGEYYTNVVTWPIGYFVNSKFSLNVDEVGFAVSLKLPKAL